MEKGVHPAPFRTRKLSPSSPMILHIYMWERRPGPTLKHSQALCDYVMERFACLERSVFFPVTSSGSVFTPVTYVLIRFLHKKLRLPCCKKKCTSFRGCVKNVHFFVENRCSEGKFATFQLHHLYQGYSSQILVLTCLLFFYKQFYIC